MFFNNTYYVEVESGTLLRDVVRSWKMIRGKSWKSHRNFLEKKDGTLVADDDDDDRSTR